MSARSAGDELRPATNVSHVLEPTPTYRRAEQAIAVVLVDLGAETEHPGAAGVVGAATTCANRRRRRERAAAAKDHGK